MGIEINRKFATGSRNKATQGNFRKYLVTLVENPGLTSK